MNWKDILMNLGKTINEELESCFIYYDKSKVKDNWLGYDPCTDEAIEKKEKELNVVLPESYKKFLKTSNGFKQISTFAGHLLPIEKIGFLKDLEPYLYEVYELEESDVSDEDYFNYTASQVTVNFRIEYLLTSIVISQDVEGAVVMLNPNIKFGKEWEAWIFSNSNPGPERFKSFKELISKEHESTLRLLKKK